MAQDFIPNNDREFLVWMQNFLEVSNEFKAELEITPTQLQEMADVIANFNNDLGKAESIAQQAVVATRQKNASREAGEGYFRTIARKFKGIINIADTILLALRLRVNDGERTRRAPVAPDDVIAKREANGDIHIEWDAVGNTQGTQYIIERRIVPETEFTIKDTSTRRSYTDKDVPLGKTAVYRIIAQRANVKSDPSMTVTI